jgi:hypothetical protein
MTTPSCPECGAPSGDGRSCPDRLYELLLLKYREHEAQYRLAAACYALQHPRTHSPSCLALARFQAEAALQAMGEAGEERAHTCPIARWIASRLPRLRQRWLITIASFGQLHPGSDDQLLIAWAREVLAGSPAPDGDARPN